jgi:hypothetical protein
MIPLTNANPSARFRGVETCPLSARCFPVSIISRKWNGFGKRRSGLNGFWCHAFACARCASKPSPAGCSQICVQAARGHLPSSQGDAQPAGRPARLGQSTCHLPHPTADCIAVSARPISARPRILKRTRPAPPCAPLAPAPSCTPRAPLLHPSRTSSPAPARLLLTARPAPPSHPPTSRQPARILPTSRMT